MIIHTQGLGYLQLDMEGAETAREAFEVLAQSLPTIPIVPASEGKRLWCYTVVLYSYLEMHS